MFTRTPRLVLFPSLVAFALVACAPSSLQPTTSTDRSLASKKAAASGTPGFGTAGNFAILAGTAVTCTRSTVTGNVGVSPGTAITQTGCNVIGTLNPGDSIAAAAQADFATTYGNFAKLGCDVTLTTLDGQTLAPGVYCFDAAVTSTGGVLTLNGPANGLWIFKVGTLGTGALTGTNFTVTTTNGTPPACNSVYWWTAEAATLTTSTFVGTILSGMAATVTGGTFSGNIYAKAAVTVTDDVVTGCGLGGGTGGGTCTGKDGEDEDCACQESEDDDDSRSMSMSSSSSDHGKKCRHDRDDHEDDDDGHHDNGHDGRKHNRK
jgi:hypothetical protein